MEDSDREMAETQFRQETLRGYMAFGKLYAQLSFDPLGTPYHPAINGTPEQVAKWLRQLADDIEGIK